VPRRTIGISVYCQFCHAGSRANIPRLEELHRPRAEIGPEGVADLHNVFFTALSPLYIYTRNIILVIPARESKDKG
jgi:hypothetical protein